MFAAANVKEEPLEEASPPAQTLTDAERTALQLQECNPGRCNEKLCKLREEALAEGQSRRTISIDMLEVICEGTRAVASSC